MRVLSCRINESIIIGDVTLTLLEIRHDRVRFKVGVSKDNPVHGEIAWHFRDGPVPLVLLNPAWLTWNDGTILRLARAIDAEEDYHALPILADALEEAGCDHAAILDHCRCCRPGACSSWVVDFILAASRCRDSRRQAMDA